MVNVAQTESYRIIQHPAGCNGQAYYSLPNLTLTQKRIHVGVNNMTDDCLPSYPTQVAFRAYSLGVEVLHCCGVAWGDIPPPSLHPSCSGHGNADLSSDKSSPIMSLDVWQSRSITHASVVSFAPVYVLVPAGSGCSGHA